jgi:uncharacterized protein YyaL (SSP411 family)
MSFAKKMNCSLEEFELKISKINQQLLDERSHRIRPGTDDKCLTSWNAITIKGLCDAYSAFGEEEFLHLAIKNARWIVQRQITNDGKLFRTYKNGNSTINAFLEDYAHVICAFIELYEVTFDSEWLEKASQLTEITLKEFHDEKSKMFFFTSNSTQLIARKMELNDNVLPASNSVMAHNLFRLSHLYYNNEFKLIAEQMLANIYDGMEMYGSGYSNWGSLLINIVNNYYHVSIMGNQSQALNLNLLKNYLPNVLCAGGNDLKLPVLADKKNENETIIYVCYDRTCLSPVKNIEEVIRLVIQ